MEFEFDKEIDALLRQTAKGESAFASGIPNSNHLDADEISAFAENALPGMAKQRYTAHLANCNSCRKSLSNLILRNPETKSETVHAEETAAISSTIPWHKHLFAFPNLAYTLGALVLVFSGIIGFVVVQNMNKSQNAEVSQISEKLQSNNGIFQNNEAAPTPTGFSNNANIASNTNAASVSSSNSTAEVPAMNSNMNIIVSKPSVLPNAAPKNEPRREDNSPTANKENNFQADGTIADTQIEKKQDSAAVNDNSAEDDKTLKSETKLSARQTSELPKAKTLSSTLKKAEKSDAANSETTRVGGKTFNRRNNVWYDAAYNNQKTTNITRGTSEYKKLDADLRVIVENLGGTVVIIWKEKAYRIQ